MSWIYKISINDSFGGEVGKVESDWNAELSTDVGVPHGSGADPNQIKMSMLHTSKIAVVAEQNKEPNYTDLTSLDYVDSVEERKEIPDNPSGKVEIYRGEEGIVKVN